MIGWKRRSGNRGHEICISPFLYRPRPGGSDSVGNERKIENWQCVYIYIYIQFTVAMIIFIYIYGYLKVFDCFGGLANPCGTINSCRSNRRNGVPVVFLLFFNFFFTPFPFFTVFSIFFFYIRPPVSPLLHFKDIHGGSPLFMIRVQSIGIKSQPLPPYYRGYSLFIIFLFFPSLFPSLPIHPYTYIYIFINVHKILRWPI